jgi:glycosyltransferase involved in cell wall biosynthesis
LLFRLVTDYPRSYPARFGVPPALVTPLLATGFYAHALRRVQAYLPGRLRSRLFRGAHQLFSRELAKVVPQDADVFVGLSSFCLEALTVCRENAVVTAVDHGSLHQAEDRSLVLEECKRWGVPPEDLPEDWLIEKEDSEFAQSDHVFALSTVARDSLVRHGVPGERIFVNAAGVDIVGFTPGPKNDSTFRVIQAGRLSVRKGALDLMAAFAEAQMPNAELWFVGDHQCSPAMSRVIASLRGPRVRFLPPVSQMRLPDIYRQCSVLVLASVADGFGMVVPQAMACGLPVVVTENVGARDLVIDGHNGFVVPIRSPRVLADRLRFLHENPDQTRRMGECARDSVAQGYTWHEYGNRLAQYLLSRSM